MARVFKSTETHNTWSKSGPFSPASIRNSAQKPSHSGPRFVPEIEQADVTPWTTGIEQIDACLPEQGLSRSGLHEIEPLRPCEMPSLTGFAFGLLSRLRSFQPIIWCVIAQQVKEHGQLYAHGLQRYGISPAQIIFARVNHPLHLHFALEEALKVEGVCAVIGEGPCPTFTGSRRLSLLTREHGRPCILLNPAPHAGRGSAALTRWQITPCQGVEDPHDPFGPGLPTWRMALPRVRGGRSMPGIQPDIQPGIQSGSVTENNSYPWRVVWDDQTLSFRPASVFRSGAVPHHKPPQDEQDQAMVG